MSTRETLHRKGVALAGFMGVGKTRVGELLAEQLDLPFVDLDHVLEAQYGSIATQFQSVGEVGFRARERACLLALCDETARVLATGGGAWLDARNRDALAPHYARVVLTASPEAIRTRLEGDASRPLWSSRFEALLAERQQDYAYADVHVDTTLRTPDEVVEEIVVWLKQWS